MNNLSDFRYCFQCTNKMTGIYQIGVMASRCTDDNVIESSYASLKLARLIPGPSPGPKFVRELDGCSRSSLASGVERRGFELESIRKQQSLYRRNSIKRYMVIKSREAENNLSYPLKRGKDYTTCTFRLASYCKLLRRCQRSALLHPISL